MGNAFFTSAAAALVLVLGLGFAFANAFRNSSLIISTVVSTRVLSPWTAFVCCAVSEFVGGLILGHAILFTVSRKILVSGLSHSPSEMLQVLCAALVSTIAWALISWWRAWPTSNSHSLFGALAGGGCGAWGTQALMNSTWASVMVILVLSPVLGFLGSWMITSFLRWIGQWMTIHMIPILQKVHVAASLVLAAIDGSNEAQMVVGIYVLGGLFVHTAAVGSAIFSVPWGIRVLVAGSMALGVSLGGRRIIRKLGMGFYRIQTAQGSGAQMAAVGVALSCLLNGTPASLSQLVTGSILGAGVSKNPRSIRWPVAQEIAVSWLVTLPATGALAFALFRGLRFMGRLV